MKDCSIARLFGWTVAGVVALEAAAMPKLSGNLRNYAAEKEAFLKELAAETNAFKNADLKLAYAKFEYVSAMDDQPEKWRKLQVEAYETPGLTPVQKLELLKKGVWGKSFETDGWKVAEGHPETYWAYFNHIRFITRMGPSELGEKGSWEHRAEMIKKALELTKDAGFFFDYIHTLTYLGRTAEVEKELAARLASAKDDPRSRFSLQRALGEYWGRRAKRYYGEANPECLRKALACHQAAIEEQRKFDDRPSNYQSAISTAFALKDYAAVEKLLEAYRACVTKRANGTFKPDGWYAVWTGDLAYYRGDYAKAVEGYELAPFDSRPSVATHGVSAWDRYASSLYATGQYEKCLKVIPKLASWCSLADRNALYKRILTEKIETVKKEKK